MIRLIWKKNNKERKEFKLNSEEFTIGRETGSLIIPDDKFISSEHAVIFKDEKSNWVIEDLGSVNKIYVNGKIWEAIYLHSGDKINIGRQTFIFCNDEEKNFETKGFNAWWHSPKMNLTLIIQGTLLTVFLILSMWYSFATFSTQKNAAIEKIEIAVNCVEIILRGETEKKFEYFFKKKLKKIEKLLGKSFGAMDYSKSEKDLKFINGNYFHKETKIGKVDGVIWIQYSLSFIYKKILSVILFALIIYILLALVATMLPKLILSLFDKKIDEFRMDLDALGRKSISFMPENYQLDSLNALADTVNRIVRRENLNSDNKGNSNFWDDVAATPLPVMLFDNLGKLERINAYAEKQFPELSIGKSLFEFSDNNQIFKSAITLMENGGETECDETKIKVKVIENNKIKKFLMVLK